jgi:DNA-binding MarR family transcriptional regulator
MTRHEVDTAMLLLAAASRLVEGIQHGIADRGYPELRPAHGFAFSRIASGDATVLDIAAHLGVTKQAASQLVELLVQRGYVRRRTDPADARRRVLALTAAGRSCTQAAEDAARETMARWRPELGATGLRDLHALLGRLDLAGPVRPAW